MCGACRGGWGAETSEANTPRERQRGRERAGDAGAHAAAPPRPPSARAPSCVCVPLGRKQGENKGGLG